MSVPVGCVGAIVAPLTRPARHAGSTQQHLYLDILIFYFIYLFGIIYLYSTVLGQQESCYKNSDNVVYGERGWISITRGSAMLEINVLKKLGRPRIPHGGSGLVLPQLEPMFLRNQ